MTAAPGPLARALDRSADRVCRLAAAPSGLAALLLLALLVFAAQWLTSEMKAATMVEGWFAERAWSLVRFGNFYGSMWPDLPEARAGVFGVGKIYLATLAMALQLGGVSLASLRLVALGYGAAAVTLMYLLGRRLFGPAAGVIAAGLLVTARMFRTMLDDSRPEMMILAFTLLALYGLVRYQQQRRPLVMFLTGLVSALTLDLHLNALPVPLATGGVAVYWALTRRIRPGELLPLGGGCVAAFGLWYAGNIAIYEPAYFFGTVLPVAAQDGGAWSLDVVTGKAAKLAEYFLFWRNGWNGPELLVLLLGGLLCCRWHRADANTRLLLVWLAVALPLTAVYNKTLYPGHIMTLLPVAYLLCAGQFARPARPDGLTALFRAALLVLLLLNAGHSVMSGALELRRHRETGRQFSATLAALRRHIPPDAVVLGQPAYWFGFAEQQYYPGQFYMGRIASATGELAADTAQQLNDRERLDRLLPFLQRRGITRIILDDYFARAWYESYAPADLPEQHFRLLGTVDSDLRVYEVRCPPAAARQGAGSPR